MMTYYQALKKANEYLGELSSKSRLELALMEDETIENEVCWIFFYQSRDFVETGNEDYLVGGNAPILIDKRDGKLTLTGTSKDAEFYMDLYLEYKDDIPEFEKHL